MTHDAFDTWALKSKGYHIKDQCHTFLGFTSYHQILYKDKTHRQTNAPNDAILTILSHYFWLLVFVVQRERLLQHWFQLVFLRVFSDPISHYFWLFVLTHIATLLKLFNLSKYCAYYIYFFNKVCIYRKKVSTLKYSHGKRKI